MKWTPKILLTLAATAAVTFAAFCAAQTPSTGSGTPDVGWYTRNQAAASFKISTADELAGLATLVNRKDSAVNFSGKTITLTKDIDLSKNYGKSYNGGKGWIPIGSISLEKFQGYEYMQEEKSFMGIFDGNGKTISGLYINDATRNAVGLFGAVLHDAGTQSECTQKYLDKRDARDVDLDELVSLCNQTTAIIKKLGVIDADIRGGIVAGGVVGCSGCGDEFDSGADIVDCYTTGTINGSGTVGGVVGHAYQSTVARSYSTAAVSGKGSVGGVVGDAQNSVVSYCYSTGTVSGDDEVGGVVGRGTDIRHCYSTGTVSGNMRVGGVVGMVWVYARDAIVGDIGKLFSSYSTSAVSGRDTVGGVVGYGLAEVRSCIALNPSVKSTRSRAGRVVGVEGILIWENHTDDYETTYRPILSNNFALSEITNNAGTTKWNSKGTSSKDGADLAVAIKTDGTIGGLFTAKNGWTTQPGKLPGLGAPVEMPPHLGGTPAAPAPTPAQKPAPAPKQASKSANPNAKDLAWLLDGQPQQQPQQRSQQHSQQQPRVQFGGGGVPQDAYLTGVVNKIERNWAPSVENSKISVVIGFSIDRDGWANDIRVTTSSGDKRVDNEGLAAVTKAAPFGKLPPNYSKNKVEINITLRPTRK